jgi:hypothetical protein
MGEVTLPSGGIPGGICCTGGRFQMIHGVKEQQDFSNGLKTITATDAAFNPLKVRGGERFPPSQVWVGGNSRKPSETISLSMHYKPGCGTINLPFAACNSTRQCIVKKNGFYYLFGNSSFNRSYRRSIATTPGTGRTPGRSGRGRMTGLMSGKAMTDGFQDE